MLLFAQTNDAPWWAYVLFGGVVLTVLLVAKYGGPDVFNRVLESDMGARGAGLFGIAYGAGMMWLFLYGPILDALEHRPRIHVSRAVVGFGALSILFGLIFLIAGKSWNKFIPRPNQTHTKLQGAVAAVVVVLCIALTFGFDYLLKMWGYTPGW